MSGRAVVERERRVFDDFFKIDEFLVSHEQIDGTMSTGQKRLVFERGDSVAVLLLNVEMKSVVLVEQLRVAALVGRRRDDRSTTDGWILETIAGMVDVNETPEAAAIRETFEETGYQIQTAAIDQQVLLLTRRRVRAYVPVLCRGDQCGQDQKRRRHRRRRHQDRAADDR
jgi:nudix-type nucleoside diphosphatase (YffH/AdpP family)